MIDSNVTGNQVISSDFLQVLLALKTNTMRATNVAEIAIISEYNVSKNELKCTLLTNPSTVIFCTSLMNLDLKINDAVLIIFTSTDFRTNLSKLKNGQQLQQIKSKEYHSKNYGVIVGVVYRKES